MNKKFVYSAITLTFIVAVLALFTAFGHSTKSAVGAVSTATTNLPSMGLATAQVGTGCDQQFTNCTPSLEIGTSTTLVYGGTRLSTTTVGNETLAASDIINNQSIISTSTVLNAAFTITLPASTSLTTFLPVAGMSRTLHFVNATTTVGVDITFAGGVGMILQSASTTKIVRNGASADFNFYRPGTTTSPNIGDIYVTMTNIGF